MPATKKTTTPTSAAKPGAAADAAASNEPVAADVPSADAKTTKPPTPARFESEHASLILYAGGKKVAVFNLGAYETDDPTVIAVLRGSADVREVGSDE